MPRKHTHIECFEFFGTKPRNTYWSWSARNEESKVVVVTLWQDELKPRDGKLTYRREGYDPITPDRRPGNKELLENLQWAMDHCDGKFKVIVAIAVDPKAEPRSIRECFPHPKLTMRVMELNLSTGSFEAEQA